MTAILIDESGDHAVVGVDSFGAVWVGASQLTSLIPNFSVCEMGSYVGACHTG